MEGAVGDEFQDWEVLLHDSNAETALTAAKFSGEKSAHFGGIEGESDSDSIIKSDYFSLDNQGRREKTVPERDLSEEEGSVESDNPSWIDPSSENRYGPVISTELWSDSGSDRSDERKLNDFDSKTESGIAEFLQGDEELSGRIQKLESLESYDTKMELGFEEFDETQSQSKDLRNLEEKKNIQIEETKANDESGSEVGDKRKVVWWKVPLEVLKYCLFKASPVWSFSVAAAVMGFIILGRRLYRMKRKTQSLNLKVILDEKKGSPFMSRAARLNEAFSVVRRVPIVRPALPAAGINPWPAMSMS
ncbi:uncharacterized protein LOC111432784 [Cucurbita moschata]|uniref:Uncharacterized protein LOC111432784 n=1 Tax=Cucurbita moschata TaxID=3662 RepID=A0A6J1ECE3_CUCMO|nr:uncharacterized protein LOC111432784 [Cucurbita moschata]XP_022925503.1 uncharacterized protein LOC111432784 [Cucurbita moschata]XP_022925504.1 uncharacterized protein LOC111432784 [Cucurbita moschata]XP_022925505.1 uncharacterized protein LOC111432784 [Cucurbita moschata]XP_022925506.1 uncharacterized protein LOC111432784 [Cucurbita moschata]XP_022925507.1 uncharacterized protein LOC111432784 [Cucurbita moschata]